MKMQIEKSVYPVHRSLAFKSEITKLFWLENMSRDLF